MKPTIALFLHQPKCSVQSGNGIMKALSDDYRFKIFTKHDLEDDFFDDVDMVCVPGGIGDADSFDYLMRENSPRIKDFVMNGGRYLGICMGAYWADKTYFDILDKVDAVQYITQPNTCTRRPHAKNMPVMWRNEPHNMFFYDGCALVGGDMSPYETVATYSNGDNMAIIQNRIGLIGCHPESENHWYESYSWMRGKYHNGSQHKLLLNFVNELMER
jgi:glutamine amidotransferase-like uncharacterized protein